MKKDVHKWTTKDGNIDKQKMGKDIGKRNAYLNSYCYKILMRLYGVTQTDIEWVLERHAEKKTLNRQVHNTDKQRMGQ